MPDRPVVVNNTPLVSLWALDRLDLFRDLWGQILIPEAVRDEFLAIEQPARTTALEEAPWIRSIPLSSPKRALAFAGLDRGEAEVLALAEETGAQLVVLDERRGRRFAQRMGFALTGTLGLLLLAKEEGLIPSVGSEIQKLQTYGLFIEDTLARRVLNLAGEDSSIQTQES